jgi:GNAT superfamily N-acetyltransferase
MISAEDTANKSIEIRPIVTGELDDLLLLYTHLHETDDELPPRETVEAVWDEILDDPRQKCVGLFLEGRLVSSCVLTVIPNLTRGCRPYGVLENVVTHPAFRRQGLGRTLVTAALGFAWDRGCYKVMLLTGRKTESVFRFYESAGFDRYSKQAFIAKPPPSSRNVSE